MILKIGRYRLKIVRHHKKTSPIQLAFPNARDVSAGATGATLTLSQPGGADFAHHRRGRT